MDIGFKIDGQAARQPVEYKGLEVELNFENPDEVQTSFAAGKLTFVNEDADRLNSLAVSGLNGGLGIFFGVPLDIEFGGHTLKADIDLTEEAEFSCEKVLCKVREAKGIDWMEKVADGFDFNLLSQLGYIFDTDRVKVPYIVSEIPNYRDAAIMSLTAFMIFSELVKVAKDIANIIGDLGGVFNAGGGAIKLIFYVVYLAGLLIALFKMIKAIIGELIQAVKYHYGMMVQRLLIAGCAYLNLSFSSSIFDPNTPTNNELPSGLYEKLLFLPKKSQAGLRMNQTSIQTGYPDMTFGAFLRGLQAVFNAKIVLINDKLIFERRDFGSSTAVWQVPDVRKRFHSLNTDEVVSNYLIQFQVDPVDLTTINQYSGTNAKIVTTHKVYDATKTNLLNGFKQPNIPFALGKRKNSLTRVEQIADSALTLVNTLLTPIILSINILINTIASLIGVINDVIAVLNTIPGINLNSVNVPQNNFNPPNFSETISGRIGMLSLSNDLTDVPKLLMITGSGNNVKIDLTNDQALNAENLWTKYHYLESFVPSETRPAGNQAYVYSIPVIDFCKEDYDKITGNSNEGPAKILSPEGNECRIQSIKWNIWQNKASIKYKESKLYTANLREFILKNEGN